MNTQFVPIAFAEIHAEVQQHLASLPARIDSFLEEHILASQHYRILLNGQAAGFAAIHNGQLITQFALAMPYKPHGQPVFQQLRKLERVQEAFVPTCDEFFLAHALDEYRQLAKQAYFFRLGQPAQPRQIPSSYALRLAARADTAFIQHHTGDFFARVERYIEAQELFLVQSGEACVGFGLLDTSSLYPDGASTGMYTLEGFRRQGVGTATITLLIAECARRGLQPVAGCWYGNHASKQTLERAGMFTQTRLLKIDF